MERSKIKQAPPSERKPKEGVIHKVGDKVEELGDKVEHDISPRMGDAVEKVGDKIEHIDPNKKA